MYKSNYNYLEKLLHSLALGNSSIAEISFELNYRLNSKKLSSLKKIDSPVFISGLARSGTTALMNLLNDTGHFTSLSYSDMPFVLAPNLWSKINTTKKSESIERSHKDGIYINNQSPEALDEIFWKVFLDKNYIKKDKLLINQIPIEILNKFQKYIDLILLNQPIENKRRYLSKNNNNILRLNELNNFFPSATFIIPFRKPLEHAESLLNQHLHFSKKQSEDPFVLKYMNWLGHFEFGLNQKPFDLNNNITFSELKHHSKNSINYWLIIWYNYYKYVSSISFLNKLMLIEYEEFSANNDEILLKILQHLDINSINSNQNNFVKREKSKTLTIELDEALLDKCNQLYQLLQSKKLKI